MNARAVLIVLLMIGAPLAGCISGGEEPVDQTDTTDGPAPTTDSPEGRGRIVAFEETNETEQGVGGIDHHHDYWQGRERVTIFETETYMHPEPDSNNRAWVVFRPPQGTFIYEGTDTVEFTIMEPKRHACEGRVVAGGHYICTSNWAGVSVDDPTPPTGLTIRYKHAATTEWIDAGAIAWDEPAKIKITNPIQTDMPHATSSVWEFQIISPNPQDVTLMFKAKAEIVRAPGDDIPLWPGHPLFYDEERTSRIVLDTKGAACDGRTQTGCTLVGSTRGVMIPAEKLVSYGTRTLHVWINITEFHAPVPATAPSAFFLFHNNATGRENITDPFDFENYGIDKRELYWALPVDDNGMDSPYADGSRWQFALGASYTAPDNPVYRPAVYGGIADWGAKYDIKIIASSIELSPGEYHLHCLDTEVYCGEEEAARRR